VGRYGLVFVKLLTAHQSAPGNQHFRELLPIANDVINMYMTSKSTGNVGLSCD